MPCCSFIVNSIPLTLPLLLLLVTIVLMITLLLMLIRGIDDVVDAILKTNLLLTYYCWWMTPLLLVNTVDTGFNIVQTVCIIIVPVGVLVLCITSLGLLLLLAINSPSHSIVPFANTDGIWLFWLTDDDVVLLLDVVLTDDGILLMTCWIRYHWKPDCDCISGIFPTACILLTFIRMTLLLLVIIPLPGRIYCYYR